MFRADLLKRATMQNLRRLHGIDDFLRHLNQQGRVHWGDLSQLGTDLVLEGAKLVNRRRQPVSVEGRFGDMQAGAEAKFDFSRKIGVADDRQQVCDGLAGSNNLKCDSILAAGGTIANQKYDSVSAE